MYRRKQNLYVSSAEANSLGTVKDRARNPQTLRSVNRGFPRAKNTSFSPIDNQARNFLGS
jgi:hypothetical protein